MPVEHVLVYLRIVLYPLTALALFIVATRRKIGTSFHWEKVALIVWMLILMIAAVVRAVYGPLVSVHINDYIGVPALALVCVSAWWAVWLIRK